MRITFLFICGCAAAQIAGAQASVQYASVAGVVTDPTGGLVQGAQVSVRQKATNSARELMSDQEGRFRFLYLRVGDYEVRVEKSGFAPATREVMLTVGSAFDLLVSLTL